MVAFERVAVRDLHFFRGSNPLLERQAALVGDEPPRAVGSADLFARARYEDVGRDREAKHRRRGGVGAGGTKVACVAAREPHRDGAAEEVAHAEVACQPGAEYTSCTGRRLEAEQASRARFLRLVVQLQTVAKANGHPLLERDPGAHRLLGHVGRRGGRRLSGAAVGWGHVGRRFSGADVRCGRVGRRFSGAAVG